jgi:hypothetical protein
MILLIVMSNRRDGICHFYTRDIVLSEYLYTCRISVLRCLKESSIR